MLIVVLRLWLVELVPWVLPETFNVDALLWIGYEYLRDDVFGIGREELGKGIISIQNFLVQVRSFLVFEWKVSAQHSVQDDSTTPNVRFEPVVTAAGDHLQNKRYRWLVRCLPLVLRSTDFHKQSSVSGLADTCCSVRSPRL